MKNKTIDFYNREAKSWLKNHPLKKGTFREKLVNEYKKLLSNGKILEIGCGPGLDAKLLIGSGFDYTGTDASKEFIKLAKKLNPNAKFTEVSIENLNFPKNTFDGFWSSATLLHIPKNEINNALEKIKKVCKVGSIGLITLKEGVGEGEEKETGRWFSFYKKGEFEEILNQNGLKTIRFKIFKDQRKNKPNWLIFFVRVAK